MPGVLRHYFQYRWWLLLLSLGADGADRRRRREQLKCAARHRVPAGNPARRWKLGRRSGHRHWFPESFLSGLSPVQRLFSTPRADFVREDKSSSEWLNYEISACDGGK